MKLRCAPASHSALRWLLGMLQCLYGLRTVPSCPKSSELSFDSALLLQIYLADKHINDFMTLMLCMTPIPVYMSLQLIFTTVTELEHVTISKFDHVPNLSIKRTTIWASEDSYAAFTRSLRTSLTQLTQWCRKPSQPLINETLPFHVAQWKKLGKCHILNANVQFYLQAVGMDT